MAAPGVVVEETGLPSVTVKKSPAVPLFVGMFFTDNGTRLPIATGCLRIEDSLALCLRFPNAISTTVKINGSTIEVKFPGEQTAAQALLHYFDQGGGPCWILPLASSTDNDYAAHITDQVDVTMLASAIPDAGRPDTIDAQMQALLNARTDWFYIMHSGNLTMTPTAPRAAKAQTALYYPFLEIPAKHWRDDAHIPVSGLTGVTTLAALKLKNPDLYAQADDLINKRYSTYKTAIVPPAPAVAAAYCKTARTRGVWKAPANIVIDNAEPYTVVTAAEHGEFNDRGINIIRKINGQTTIWGARTCDSTAERPSYVSTRRLFNQVQRDVTQALAAFESLPNSKATWVKAKAAIDSYLYNIWQLGGLQGDKPEEGYSVSFDMTPEEIADGKLVATIALAPSRPAEFIMLRCSHHPG